MLILKLSSMDGVPPARPLQASFGEAGGTIGRADTNRLVLPDPSRHISRVHARVQCGAGGSPELVNEGANPIGHNGRPLRNGQRVSLAPGDRLRIGGYELVAEGTHEDPATLIGAGVGAAPAVASLAGLFGDADAGEAAPASVTPPAAGLAPALPPPALVPTPATADDLTRAFLRGAGVPGLPMPALTAEALHEVGALLREATQGTLDLLAARALTRRDVGAEVTTIASRDNNALKFSPNVEVALGALLAPRGSGFLAPVAAMRDAYDDLRSHQLGIVAGMRAALAAVLRRFDPQALEKHLADKSLLDSVLPMNRRSRLWCDYECFYRELAAEAEDDFHALFGREFLSAYEAQKDRLADAARDARP